MARATNTQVSIVGSSYFDPIADLIDRLLRHPRPRTNAVQSGDCENGYAASIVLLLVAMFESYVVRVRYAHGTRVPTDMRGALDVLFHLYPRIRYQKALSDVYVLRDTLFHNHLWEIQFSWGGSHALALHGASRHPSSGDRKYLARVNAATRRTKALGLSVIPTRVDRRDARKVFDTVWKTLLFLESQDRFQCYVSHLHVRFRGKTVLFGDLRAHL